MGERVADLWGTWTAELPSVVLALLLVVAVGLWVTSSVLASRFAVARSRSPYWWGAGVTLPATAVLAFGLIWPHSFQWAALSAGVSSVLFAALGRGRIASTATTCEHGHDLNPLWVHCPRCAPSSPRQVMPVGTTAVPGRGAAPRPHASPTAATILPGRTGTAPGGAVPSGPVLLRLIPDRSTGREVVIHTSGALIGRNPAAEVVVDDAAASWEHARIVERHGSASVMDLGSSNGTFVNDELVESSLLISGDRLRVGDTVFRVVV
jgi:hypothetical protein